MTSTIQILGKKRKLTGTFGSYFLADMKDVDAVGVYHALPDSDVACIFPGQLQPLMKPFTQP